MSSTGSAPPAETSSRAPSQGGVIDGADPSVYDPKNPIIIFIIQAGIIIIFCRLLHYPLSYLRQPRVIAEVIGGILLGPSVMGRIPGFSDTIFPEDALPNLTLVANLGLVLFLFLVGLEVDLRYLISNWRVAISVGIASMALPFGLGCAIAWGLYNEFREEADTKPISFGIYMLFIGVAMAITAFPVLCRILTELKLLGTPVGIIVLSAGVGNDVVGWILLALCVALVNAGSGLTALYILLVCVGYILFLTYGVRPGFMWVLRKSNALTDGPSQGIVALTLLMALASAFFTGVIGVHPIFGAFIAGLLCPHEGGFAIKLTEKIEDLITTMFLPLYFALSGLSTNLGLLDNGITWGYVFGVISCAFVGKFAAGTVAAKLNGLVWRESAAIGSLMSCKGLVELIVLNIGLQAQILSVRTFTIFVVMALVTTFATTPLTSALYPPWYQKKIEAWKRGELDWESGEPTVEISEDSTLVFDKLETKKIRKLLVYLRLDNMPGLLAFSALLGGNTVGSPKVHPSQQAPSENDDQATGTLTKKPIQAHGVRLVELTERESSWMQVSEQDEYSAFDPVVNTFRIFGKLHNLAVSGEVKVIPESSFAETLTTRAGQIGSDMILLPWSETGAVSESNIITKNSTRSKLEKTSYNNFVSAALSSASCGVALFVNSGFGGGSKNESVLGSFGRPGLSRSHSAKSMASLHENLSSAPPADRSHHVFCPFFGGSDDRTALRLVLQMAENPDVTATLVHFEVDSDWYEGEEESKPNESSAVKGPNDEDLTTTTTIHSRSGAESDATLFATLERSLPAELQSRVRFETVKGGKEIVRGTLERAKKEVGLRPRNAGDVVVCGRNATKTAGLLKNEPQEGGSERAEKTLGVISEAIVRAGIRASVLSVQSRDVK